MASLFDSIQSPSMQAPAGSPPTPPPPFSAEDEALFQRVVRQGRMSCEHCKAEEIPLYSSYEIKTHSEGMILLCKRCAIEQRKKLELYWLKVEDNKARKRKQQTKKKKRAAATKVSL